LNTSRIRLGTWAIGGWMWGGTDEAQAIATIRPAVERGVTLIYTAPVYGFGRSEDIIGKALAEGGLRGKVQIATKVGLAARDGELCRDSRSTRIQREIGDSLRRLRTDVIDLYQVHWPDLETPIDEMARKLEDLRRHGAGCSTRDRPLRSGVRGGPTSSIPSTRSTAGTSASQRSARSTQSLRAQSPLAFPLHSWRRPRSVLSRLHDLLCLCRT
jgi:hypothetical protein